MKIIDLYFEIASIIGHLIIQLTLIITATCFMIQGEWKNAAICYGLHLAVEATDYLRSIKKSMEEK